jgi:hypothetical protein
MGAIRWVVVIMLLSACGASSTAPRSEMVDASTPRRGESGDQSKVQPYSGPMRLPQDFSDDASVLARAGAAGGALECDAAPYSGGGGAYDDGLESVKGSPNLALRNYFEEEFVGAQLPVTGYRIEREDNDRVLFSYDVEGRTKVAFIVADGITDYNGDRGWGVESRAACDPSELPAKVTDELGIGVWQDRSGDRLPVTTVMSYQGADHCDWEDITFLTLGEDPNSRQPAAEQYVRDTAGKLTDHLRATFDAHASLPADTEDTGYQRDGRQLWLAPDRDAAYLVRLGRLDEVERWPAATELIGCA